MENNEFDDDLQFEVIGDEPLAPPSNYDPDKVQRICILNIDPNCTIEAVYGNLSDDSANGNAGNFKVRFPHDAEETLKELYPNATITTVYLEANVEKAIGSIRRIKHDYDVFINLYDNTDAVTPAVMEYMEKQGIAFTGCSYHFYSPSRTELKRMCRYCKIGTPNFVLLNGSNFSNEEQLGRLVRILGGFPIFVKPEHGFDSVGVDEQSKVNNFDDLKKVTSKVVDLLGVALAEQYIDGREFTVLAVGSGKDIYVFPPAEYCFVENQKFITFEDKWGTGFTGSHWRLLDETEGVEEKNLIDNLINLTKKLHEGFNGDGYARYDVRQDMKTKELFVLDCNSNCSLFYKDLCSADSILKLCGWPKTKFMRKLIDEGLKRQQEFFVNRAFTVKYSVKRGYGIYASKDILETETILNFEKTSRKFMTKRTAEKELNNTQFEWFHTHGWPIAENVHLLWDNDSSLWHPYNHSCNPNGWLDGLKVVARRNIKQGEEIMLDYATLVPSEQAFQCHCNSPQCRHEIKPNEYKEQWFQDRYGSHVTPYISSLIEKEQMLKNNSNQ